MIFLGYFPPMRLYNRNKVMKNLYLCTLKTSTSSKTSSSVVLMSFGKTITFWIDWSSFYKFCRNSAPSHNRPAFN